jgi:hypothetical protein
MPRLFTSTSGAALSKSRKKGKGKGKLRRVGIRVAAREYGHRLNEVAERERRRSRKKRLVRLTGPSQLLFDAGYCTDGGVGTAGDAGLAGHGLVGFAAGEAQKKNEAPMARC